MRVPMLRTRGVIAAASALVLTSAGVAGVSMARADSPPTVFHACVKDGNGSVRIVSEGEACRSSEHAAEWTSGATGQPGPATTDPATRVNGSVTFLGLATKAPVGPLDIFSVSGSAEVPAGGGGSGPGTGKARVSTLTITKPVDQNTPLLFGSLVNGRHSNSVTVTTSTGSGQELTLTLSDVLVTSEGLVTTPGGTVVERIELDYSKVTYSAGGVSATWPASGKG